MKKNRKSLLTILLSPSVVVFVVAIIVMVVSLAFTHRIRPYNSDDVSWQNILFTWHPFSGHRVTLGGSDTFILKIPLFSLLAHFFSPSRKLLFLESSILAILTFTLFYIASLYFLVKAKIKLSYLNLLPFVWLASFGYAFDQLYLNPILRNFEIGLSFITFMLVAMVYYGSINPLRSVVSKAVTLLASITAGMLIYNDPYYLYFTVVPVALFSAVLLLMKKVPKNSVITIYACIFLSLIFAKLTSLIATNAGIDIVSVYPVQFVVFDKFFANLALSLHGILVIFGADFFGRKMVNIVTASAVVNALVVGFIFYKICQLRKEVTGGLGDKLNTGRLWTVFFGLFFVFVFTAYAFSSLAVDLNTYRYFAILVFASVLFLAITVGSLRSGRLFVAAVLIAGIVLNLYVTVGGAQGYVPPGVAGNRGNYVNYDIIHAVGSRGLTKGYGDYWQGNINTFLSNDAVEFLPILCSDGHTRPFHWLIDEARFNRSAQRSFYMIDPDLPTCTPEQIITQFGEPNDTLLVTDKTILIYNYDILSKM